MKRFLLGLIVLFVICLSVASCTEDLTEEAGISENDLQTSAIGIKHLTAIESMGFSTEGIVEEEDCYIVEGDILIDKADIDSMSLIAQTRHGYYRKILPGNASGIRVKVTRANIPDEGWYQATINAINLWNDIPNCDVYFYKITNPNLGHDTKVYMSDNVDVAAAAYPLTGLPGRRIRMNPNNRDYPLLAEKTYIMVHEFGHVLGLAHSNYEANYRADPVGHSYDNPNKIDYISGTPVDGEYRSVMYSNSAGREWGNQERDLSSNLYLAEFTGGDILAIQSMYGTPEYSITIDGPEELLPGDTATYTIVPGANLQGYIDDFGWPWWETDEEVVSETRTSITIRCNHKIVHPIPIVAYVDYNGREMGGSRVVNEAIASCYREFYGRTITGSTTVVGCVMLAGDFTVASGGSLTLQTSEIIIDAPFTVESGAELEIINQI